MSDIGQPGDPIDIGEDGSPDGSDSTATDGNGVPGDTSTAFDNVGDGDTSRTTSESSSTVFFPDTTTSITSIETPTPTPRPPVIPSRTTLPVSSWTTVTTIPLPPGPDTTQTVELQATTTSLELLTSWETLPEEDSNVWMTNSAELQDQAASSQSLPTENLSFSAASSEPDIPPASLQDSPPVTLDANPLDAGSTDAAITDTPGGQRKDGMDAGAKAGLASGIIAGVVAILLALQFYGKHAKAARRRKYLKHHSNMFQHQHSRNQSDFSWCGTAAETFSPSGEKSFTKAEGDHSVDVLSQPYLSDPLATSEKSNNTWSMWVERLAPARPPSPTASTTANSFTFNDPRISIVAPSPVSSRAALLRPGQHSRASSALSGNHLHPFAAANQRSMSVRSKESLATAITSSGEPSPVFGDMTGRFPMPSITAKSTSQDAGASTSVPLKSPTQPLASKNPCRTSTWIPSDTGQPKYSERPYSQKTMASDDGRNPFEFEMEASTLGIDFTRIGLAPTASGHTSLNPTTPITPKDRRKSTSSLSLYSEEGHATGDNPFSGVSTPRHTTYGTIRVSPRDSMAEALDLAKSTGSRPWSPLNIGTTEVSRDPSFASERSGPDPNAWEDEMNDTTRTPKTFSKILEMYAGRAL